MAHVEKFRFWCQKVLPLVYDDSLSYYEVLCKVVDKLNEVISAYNGVEDMINTVQQQMKAYTDQQIQQTKTELTADYTQKIDSATDTLNGRITALAHSINVQITNLSSQVDHLTQQQGQFLADLTDLQTEMGEVKQWIAQFDWDPLYQMVKDMLADYIPSQMSAGVTDDGHFVVMYWKPWQDLVFNTTGYDISIDIQPQFGHLLVSY